MKRSSMIKTCKGSLQKCRFFAFILCIALVLESMPGQALAAENAIVKAETPDTVAGEYDYINNTENNDQTDKNTGNDNSAGDSMSDDSGNGAGDSSGAGGQDNSENDRTDEDGNNTDDDSQDINDSDSDNPEDDNLNNNDSNNDGSGSDSTDTSEDSDDIGSSNESSDSESDSISENDLESVSGNDLSSISENSLDDNLQTLIKAAEEAFERLLAEKSLMALLYHADSYSVRSMPDADSGSAATIEIGQTLYIMGVVITEEDVWYRVQFWLDGVEGTGYVQSYYLAYSDEDWLAWEEEWLLPILEAGEDYGISAYGMSTYSMTPYAIDTSDISAFPGSYQSELRSLKNAHPNWTFVPMKTGLDFNTAVSKEMGDRSLIQKTTSNVSKGWVGNACPSESGWYYATRPAVAYYMDPRNFLTETYIFQFEQLTFNGSYHTQSAVQTFLNGTFMKGTLPDDSAKRTYAQAFYEIGKNRKLSPIHLASRVYQEQGQGTSGLISGKYPGYEGYYNFFNVGVNGSSTEEKITKGLTYAKKQGWNTRYKSLEGGAATIGNNYILKYQDTIYLEKFNVDKNSPYGVYNHQYMQNIQAPASESSSTKKMYTNAGSLNSAFVFKIPVYNNMPDEQYYPELKLNKTTMTMDRSSVSDCENGQQLKLYADGVEIDPSCAEVSWKSSDTSVVTVQSGRVFVVDVGEAVVTVFYSGVETSCKVTVQASLQNLSLDKTEISLRRPDTVVEDVTGLSEAEKKENISVTSLQVSFEPADTTSDRTIVWTSSNTKVVKVTVDPEAPKDTSRAIVTAVGKGEAVITAKASKAGGKPIKTAACKVRVSAPIYRAALSNPNAKDTDTEDTTTLLAGQSVNLAVEYWPKDTTSDTQVLWSSSDEKVAVVKNGRVEVLSRGTAVITAKVAGCEQGYTAQHTIVAEECRITFMKSDGADGYSVLKEEPALYGKVLSEQDFPDEKSVETEGSLFIGWYTKPDGMGSRFDVGTAIYQKDTVLYPYYEEQGKGFYVLPVGDQVYTGGAIKPAVWVYDSVSYDEGGTKLIELILNKDYTISYKNNKNVNPEGKAVPTITIKGKGNYAGTEYIYFNIVPKALTDTDITADDITVAYSGKTIKSAPVIYRNGKKLIKNTDYTVTYPQTGTGAYQTAGTYPILITGKGGYSGKITVYETITQNVLMSKVSIAKIPNQTYRNDQVDKEAGIGIMPASLKVTYKKEVLTESMDGGLTGDYTVSYKNNTAVGTATATITAVEGSGFTGSKSITYKIVGTSIARARVEGLENKEYTGSEEDVRQISGDYTLTLNGNILSESMDGGITGDYVVSYSNISKVGTASILFKGINEYTGQIKKTYKITGYVIGSSEDGVSPAISMAYYTQDAAADEPHTITDLSEITTPYVKGGSRPTVILTFDGRRLEQGKDYTVKYANNNAVTTEDTAEKKLPRITITGKGNFKGSITGNYRITDGAMSSENGKLTMSAKDVVYKNRRNAYKSSIVLTDCNGAKLAAGKDYDKNLIYTYKERTELIDSDGNVILREAGDRIEASDIPEAGTVIRVTARGKGCYEGDGEAEISADYRIVASDIARARVKAAAKVYRNGQPVTLSGEDLTVTISGSTEPLQYGVDYMIDENTYIKNQNKGKATVTIRGLGNYGGEKKITYAIGSKTLVWWKNLF